MPHVCQGKKKSDTAGVSILGTIKTKYKINVSRETEGRRTRDYRYTRVKCKCITRTYIGSFYMRMEPEDPFISKWVWRQHGKDMDDTRSALWS
jgi:hypothetical protein